MFAKINTRECRHDLRLRLDAIVAAAVRGIIGGTHARMYTDLLPSDAKLVELGVITSHSGAQRQAVHSDVE